MTQDNDLGDISESGVSRRSKVSKNFKKSKILRISQSHLQCCIVISGVNSFISSLLSIPMFILCSCVTFVELPRSSTSTYLTTKHFRLVLPTTPLPSSAALVCHLRCPACTTASFISCIVILLSSMVCYHFRYSNFAVFAPPPLHFTLPLTITPLYHYNKISQEFDL
jgi:hypothetical protein